MIQGPTMWRATAKRPAVERTTSPASQPQAGTRRRVLTANSDLTQARGEPRHVRHPGPGGRSRELAEHRILDRVRPGRDLERLRVEVGDVTERVLALDIGARRRAERRTVLGGDAERSLERRDL